MGTEPSAPPGLAQRLRGWARRLKREALTLWLIARDPRTPWAVRALAVVIVAYAASPIDLIPDFIPVLGFVDDVLLLPGLIWLALRLTPPAVREDCRREADRRLAEGAARPRSRAGAVAIVALWLLALAALAAWAWARLAPQLPG